MVDVVDAETRSRMMSGIRGLNTKPEVALRRALHALGFRFRLHARELPGKPDIVLPKYRAVLFVHGCFWHRHKGCRYATTPGTRPEFWATKFLQNIARDDRNAQLLSDANWSVATVWECSLRSAAPAVADELACWLRSDGSVIEIPQAVAARIPTE